MSGEIRSSLSVSAYPDREQFHSAVSGMLCGSGYTEIMNNSLTKSRYSEDVSGFEESRNVHILNPLSKDLDVMRQSLLFGFLETVSYNINRRTTDLKVFEWGNTYFLNPETSSDEEVTKRYSENYMLSIGISGQQMPETWYTESKATDFYYLASTVQRVISRLGFDMRKIKQENIDHQAFSIYSELRIKKDVIGFIGQVHPKTLKYFDIRQNVFYAELNWNVLLKYVAGFKTLFSGIPRFPEVRRDLALLVDKGVSYRQLEDAAYHADNKYLKKVSLFDVYEGDKIIDGKKSYALSFILLDDQQTLTDQVIEKVMERITQSLISKTGASIR
jgi:phenylalanyl-tRNA synthetase beta chain